MSPIGQWPPGCQKRRCARVDTEPEPASLVELRPYWGMLPRVDVSDMLLELDAWIGCLDVYDSY